MDLLFVKIVQCGINESQTQMGLQPLNRTVWTLGM